MSRGETLAGRTGNYEMILCHICMRYNNIDLQQRQRSKYISSSDQRTGVGSGRRVHLRIATDVGCGRYDGGHDGDTVVIPSHVLRTVCGDHGGRGDHCGR